MIKLILVYLIGQRNSKMITATVNIFCRNSETWKRAYPNSPFVECLRLCARRPTLILISEQVFENLLSINWVLTWSMSWLSPLIFLVSSRWPLTYSGENCVISSGMSPKLSDKWVHTGEKYPGIAMWTISFLQSHNPTENFGRNRQQTSENAKASVSKLQAVSHFRWVIFNNNNNGSSSATVQRERLRQVFGGEVFSVSCHHHAVCHPCEHRGAGAPVLVRGEVNLRDRRPGAIGLVRLHGTVLVQEERLPHSLRPDRPAGAEQSAEGVKCFVGTR